jgi:hypothetical protein
MRSIISWGCAALSALCGAAAIVVFFVAIMPAPGGDRILHAAHTLLVAATALGVVGLIAGRSVGSRLVNAVFGLAAGSVLLVGGVMTAESERSMAEGKVRRAQREAPAPAGEPVATYDAAALLGEWKAARQATDTKLDGKLVAITGLPGGMPSFDPLGARYLHVYGDSTARFYLAAPAASGTVVCRYRGTVHDDVTGEDKLHLEGCRAP